MGASINKLKYNINDQERPSCHMMGIFQQKQNAPAISITGKKTFLFTSFHTLCTAEMLYICGTKVHKGLESTQFTASGAFANILK